MKTQHIRLLNQTYKNLRALHMKERLAAWITLMPVIAPFRYRALIMAQVAHEKEVRYAIHETIIRHIFLSDAVKPQLEAEMRDWLISRGLAIPKTAQQ